MLAREPVYTVAKVDEPEEVDQDEKILILLTLFILPVREKIKGGFNK